VKCPFKVPVDYSIYMKTIACAVQVGKSALSFYLAASCWVMASCWLPGGGRGGGQLPKNSLPPSEGGYRVAFPKGSGRRKNCSLKVREEEAGEERGLLRSTDINDLRKKGTKSSSLKVT
jgi:hypothetical protein